MVISNLPRQLQSLGDIFSLGVLVAAAEQDDQEIPTLHEIDPVSGTIMIPKLAHALANPLYVPRIAKRQAARLTGDLCLGPESHSGKHCCLTDFEHLSTIGDKYWRVKYGSQDGCWSSLGLGPEQDAGTNIAFLPLAVIVDHVTIFRRQF
ncbi:MAG TPA: hypothetical protein VHU23_05915 [Rhizomicrobium sp.]|jgi:hypothetical protein|nr:hypothetical protein [Rhizomicrobium sp.]